MGYIEQLVMPELQEQEIDRLPILKATCIKFIYMFRNQIPDGHTHTFLSIFSRFLTSMSIVNQSYAAACIEKLLTKKNQQTNEPVLNADSISQDIQVSLLTNFCALLDEQKNLYAIRGLYRVIQISKTKISQFSS